MNRTDGHRLRLALIERLLSEQEFELAAKLQKCGKKILLRCLDCGHLHQGESRCDNKWCPACVQALAAERSSRIKFAVSKFKWPLFVTLTMGNVDDLEADPVRHLRQSFGRLRARKIWKDTVRGGVATIEVTNIGNGWHPHLHAVIDCRWLAIKTPPLNRHDTDAEKQEKIESAGAEFRRAWRVALRQGTDPILKVKRCDIGVCQEVVKYCIKGNDLITSPDAVGPLIRCLSMTRLLTSFGSCYGLGKQIEESEPKVPFTCPNGHSAWMPDDMVPNLPDRAPGQVTKPKAQRETREEFKARIMAAKLRLARSVEM